MYVLIGQLFCFSAEFTAKVMEAEKKDIVQYLKACSSTMHSLNCSIKGL